MRTLESDTARTPAERTSQSVKAPAREGWASTKVRNSFMPDGLNEHRNTCCKTYKAHKAAPSPIHSRRGREPIPNRAACTHSLYPVSSKEPDHDEEPTRRLDEASSADAGQHEEDAGRTRPGRSGRTVRRRSREGDHDLQERRPPRNDRPEPARR